MALTMIFGKTQQICNGIVHILYRTNYNIAINMGPGVLIFVVALSYKKGVTTSEP